MADRKNQPKCVSCHHPSSFHGGGKTECRALGCNCPMWSAPPEVDDAPS